ncbi:MAG: ATP-dependent protease ATPase subunit HslU [Anaerovibrio sp.]|uniref:ATP-dependent protease ATPase subunit HslU n=1 Tax=Anaerovibrio slackiae TaxID=2652309 RepID=UPI0023F21B32|nr:MULTISPECIES: ATP-dependent protease ATPase subunit HslU [Anaerovibrio]MBQ2410476.1 ATP-dependent protease ATPase subunit HslU [Selenomonadaceae bacterium]MBQ5586760.1 ATP-dependent protease ATPase subunit HslU [Selenomonadaceae bacterium]MBQ5731718.1 ATP-dependent protease ATPase subunit HslU [Selenomonadaceae bacterium]MBQ5846088.1 ATP-dependent protease ATPase subunit HslU [Selenomonadaceae bacterium]MBQ5920120.1 ATP-dependent protease ATPase subunit HslU [Selenomonadaceae bacterium]
MNSLNEQTPRQIVEALDKYIVGQKEAKRAVAIALRNRWRSRQLDNASMQDDIVPKNILMIGSTGVGKTEIARRLAKLVDAPFIKVEATKFTEVGYVGRDVESIIRDLAETSVRMIRQQRVKDVQEKAKEMAQERILDVLVPEPKKSSNPFGQLFGSLANNEEAEEETVQENEPKQYQAGREWCRKKLEAGEYEDKIIEIDIEDSSKPMVGMFAGSSLEGMGDNLQDMIGSMMPKRRKKRKVTVEQARKLFQQEEAMKLVDMEEVQETAVKLAENSGIVFLDEIDKVAVSGNTGGHDVSREGVQRDILPIVEGSTVMTKYGAVKTDHILFIAAGAFHTSKPSDLIPELQGRFPIRVELKSLKKEDFKRILTEPQNALLKQYKALLGTEGIKLEFAEDAIDRLAQLACDVNAQNENIGARRLHTILEKLLEELSFEAPDMEEKDVLIDTEYVNKALQDIVVNHDLSQFIL